MNKKQVIRITESELRGMIMECLKQRKNNINEGSFDARPDFCGIEGVKFIDHGEWADPELKYGNKYINYYDIEDFIIGIMKGDDLDDTDDDLFVETCRNCANMIKNEIEMYGEEREEENFEY